MGEYHLNQVQIFDACDHLYGTAVVLLGCIDWGIFSFLVFGHMHVLLLTLRCFYLCSSSRLVSDVGLEIWSLGSAPVGEFFVVTNADLFFNHAFSQEFDAARKAKTHLLITRTNFVLSMGLGMSLPG